MDPETKLAWLGKIDSPPLDDAARRMWGSPVLIMVLQRRGKMYEQKSGLAEGYTLEEVEGEAMKMLYRLLKEVLGDAIVEQWLADFEGREKTDG